jgi:hypothetical protein
MTPLNEAFSPVDIDVAGPLNAVLVMLNADE